MPKVMIKSRVIPEAVKLSHSQFIRFVSQRSGTSQAALLQAMKILKDGIKQALSEGHSVVWDGMCVFDVREIKERARYNPQKGKTEMQVAGCRVHIRSSNTLTRDVKRKTQERLENFAKNHPIKEPVLVAPRKRKQV